MITTKELVKAVQIAQGGCSVYRVSQLLEVAPSSALRWAKGSHVMKDTNAILACKYSGLDDKYVLASLAAESKKDCPSYAVWKKIVAQFEHRLAEAS